MLKEITINAILDYIEHTIEKSRTDINSLVAYSGYSRRYLQKIFKDAFGIPIGQYIQRRRITRAALLLRLTKLGIAAISEKLSYDSQQTFTREFKKNTGYTPQQYRKEKVWTFRNQTGRKHFGKSLPTPEFRYLTEQVFYGKSIIFRGEIPYSATHASPKWSVVRFQCSRPGHRLFISNDLIQGDSSNNEFFIRSIIRTSEETSDTSVSIEHGLYACFSFKGQTEDYSHYINNIYLNVLPYYGLEKRNTPDLEIVSGCTDGSFNFEYYLPVDTDSRDIRELYGELSPD